MLTVHEILYTLQGESSRVGLPCVLVRLSGCNLSCRWCDTPQARVAGGRDMSVDDVIEAVEAIGCPRVEVTGGEPMIQPAAGELLRRFVEIGFETLLETNGTVDLAVVDPAVRRIVDVKCPSSGQADRTRWSNLDRMGDRDEVKFVLSGREDYQYAVDVVRRYALIQRCGVIFSPVSSALAPEKLSEWILADRLDVRLGLQLHKIIWPSGREGWNTDR